MSTSIAKFEGMRRLSVSQATRSDAQPRFEGFYVEAKKPSTLRSRRMARHARLRKKLSGTTERPRLAVFRSNNHIYAQVIDDTQSHTLCSASSLVKDVIEETGGVGSNKEAAYVVGKHVAKRALEKGITKVCFDRGGFLYHGRVKAVADGAREAGLDF